MLPIFGNQSQTNFAHLTPEVSSPVARADLSQKSQTFIAVNWLYNLPFTSKWFLPKGVLALTAVKVAISHDSRSEREARHPPEQTNCRWAQKLASWRFLAKRNFIVVVIYARVFWQQAQDFQNDLFGFLQIIFQIEIGLIELDFEQLKG